MAEPYFPPPAKKDASPYRAPAETPIVVPARPPVVARRPARQPDVVVARRVVPKAEQAPAASSFVTTFLVRFGVRVGALGATLALVKWLIWLGRDGAKWPQAILIVLGIVGVFASIAVLLLRLRRLVRLLFARGDDA